MNPTLAHSLRQLADRLPDADARLLWRAANQLEAFRTSMQAMGNTEDRIEPIETLREARDHGERKCLLAVLMEVKGNRTWAADRLNISRTALYKFLRKHGLKPPRTPAG